MTAIAYTALRSFVETGFIESASDISILASDDSFNSVAGNFAGLLADEWILVSGTAVDDGWHQLDIDSTANKITTKSVLTDESIGSAIQIVGYFHGNGQSYSLDFESTKLDKSVKRVTSSSKALSGIEEVLLLRQDTTWNLSTGFIEEAELPYWEEFFSSVAAGESFTIDIYGSTATPVSVVVAVMEGDYSISRVETSDTYNISFKARLT